MDGVSWRVLLPEIGAAALFTEESVTGLARTWFDALQALVTHVHTRSNR